MRDGLIAVLVNVEACAGFGKDRRLTSYLVQHLALHLTSA